MIFEQLDVSLPNGFHDAMIENMLIAAEDVQFSWVDG